MERLRRENCYLATATFIGWTTASYLYLTCAKLCVKDMAAILKKQGYSQWLSPLAATAFQMATCLALLELAFVRKCSKLKMENVVERVFIGDEKVTESDHKHIEITERHHQASLVSSSSPPSISPSSPKAGERRRTLTTFTTTRTVLKEFIAVLTMSHILGSFVTNFGLFYFRNELFFILKPWEPLAGAVLYSIVTGRRQIHGISIISLLIIAASSFVFGGGLSQNSLAAGHFLSFVAAVYFALRNVTLNELKPNFKLFALRPLKRILVFLLACLIFLAGLHLSGSSKWARPCLFGLISSIFYLVSSYISVNIILEQLSVISHALTDLWTRIFVVALLAVSKSKRLSFTSATSFIACFLGLLMYLRSGRDKSVESSENIVGLPEQSNRLIFVLFATTVCGLFFYNFPLSLSQRDMANLNMATLNQMTHYFGDIKNKSHLT